MLSTSSSLLAPKQPPTARTMTYDPYLTNSSASGEGKVPEFLRPLPKPAASRYTGEAPTNFMPNYGGVRMMSKLQYHHHPAAAAEEAVNLMQKHKEAATSAVYHFPMQYFPTHTYTPLYFNSAMPHQFSLQQPSAVQTQPQQQPPPQPQPMPQQPQRPPMAFNFSKAGQSLLIQDTRPPHPHPPPPTPQQAPMPRTPTHPHPPMHQQQKHHVQQPPMERLPFKVPSGKEGSMKHRILTRPEPSSKSPLKQTTKSHFSRGSLIKLGTERVLRIEDIKTEDFIFAAEKCPALRLDPSTIVRICESSKRPQEAMIVLRYGPDQQQQTVEMEVLLEHPFFVYGKGWSSISPEKSLSCYDLPCLRLNEGDMCISLSPRLPAGLTPNSMKRRWSAPAENGIIDHVEDCHEPPVAQRTKH